MKNESIAIVVLAAGKGTRMRSSLPKVLHKIAGRSLVGHLLTQANKLNAEKTVVVTGHGNELVEREVQNFVPSAKIVEQKERLGTAHAVMQAKEALGDFDGAVLVLYGDHPFISQSTMQKVVSKVQSGASVCVLGFEPKDPAKYGRLKIGESGNLNAIIEYKDASEAERSITLCNSGIMAISGKRLADFLSKVDDNNAAGEFYLTDVVEVANKQGLKVSVAMGDEQELMGVNSQKERATAEAFAQENLRERALEEGVVLISPETVHLMEDTKLEGGCIVHPYVVFGEGSSVAAGAEIKSFSHIEGATVAANVVVGPYARLRAGADLAEGVKIGNFVEVKKAKIGEGAKINHLSYVGDADIGADVNIGAGVITCNYDGYEKHKTNIGNGAFIGSNSSLVAPVNVGAGAIVAAGSTVLKNVADGAIVNNDMKQVERAEAAAKFRDGKKG